MEYFREIGRDPNGLGNFPFGAKSSIGVHASMQDAYYALAGNATAEVFAWLLEFPPYVKNYDFETKLFPLLGESLRKHPDAAPLLLEAYDQKQHGYPYKREFAAAVFKVAGKDMLPVLHDALKSPDRVVRSNAARVCGAIGDPSSAPLLTRALDLESGLSRASIVWALGEMKAKEALQQLANLYVDASNDQRRRGAGFMAAQAAKQTESQYDQLRTLDALAPDFDELKRAALPAPANPEETDELLQPRLILEAVAKIGASAAGSFYRTLAADRDGSGRYEAAVHLAEGSPDEKERNIAVLRGLGNDAEVRVQVAAAVSLVAMGADGMKDKIIGWLKSTQRWEKEQTVYQLSERVPNPAVLGFAREALAKAARDPNLDEHAAKQAEALLKKIPAQ